MVLHISKTLNWWHFSTLADELNRLVWKMLLLFRCPIPRSASCNLKECQSVAEVQSSLKVQHGVWSSDVWHHIEGPIINKLIRVGGQLLLPSAPLQTWQDILLQISVTSVSPPRERRGISFLTIVALFIAVPTHSCHMGKGPITLFPQTEVVQDTPIDRNNEWNNGGHLHFRTLCPWTDLSSA